MNQTSQPKEKKKLKKKKIAGLAVAFSIRQNRAGEAEGGGRRRGAGLPDPSPRVGDAGTSWAEGF